MTDAATTLAPAVRPPAWTADLIASTLAPLALRDDGGVGVWSIVGDDSTATISEQFKADAGGYHARYAASEHFKILFQQALTMTGLKVADRPSILDLGSGSGVNSIVPCFELFPGARQIATDLSGDLLVILADYARTAGFADDVLCVVMDAMADHAQPERFDLVTGASILHHLVHPQRGIAAAARALKPGGHAIFLEPFDGYGLIRLAYERILAEAALRGDPLAPAVDQTLRAMVIDIAARTTPDPNGPTFADLDDKWLFSREQIEHAARANGFSTVRFVPHNDHPTLYRDVVGIQIRLATGLEGVLLPDWAMAILDDFDRAMPPPVKRLLMLEGTAVLTKGG